MEIDFYYMPGSAPCASVMLLAKTLGIHLNLKLVNLQAEEQLKPEYVQMNPQHTVPTMNDNGFYLWESRAILVYLCEQYGKGDSLYPKCPKKRALINQRLYFDAGTLYHRFSELVYPVVFRGAKELIDDKKTRLTDALIWLDGFLSDSYVAGDSMTVADYAMIATMAAIQATGIDLSSQKNIAPWMVKCKENMDGYEEMNSSGRFGEYVRSKLNQLGLSL